MSLNLLAVQGFFFLHKSINILLFIKCDLIYHTFIYALLPCKVEHHPKMTRYAAENYNLREENRQLRSLESVVKAEEVAVQVAAEIEEAFQKAAESERHTESKIMLHKIKKKIYTLVSNNRLFFHGFRSVFSLCGCRRHFSGYD